MDSELEVIRDQMHQTRASLADKLDALESQVRETVQTATDAVSTTVDTVKHTAEAVTDTVKSTVEGVTDTVSTVAEKLDVTQYVERAPWTSFGAAVAVGFAGGYLLGGTGRAEGESGRGYGETRRDWGSLEPAAEQKQAAGRQEESFLGSLMPDAVQESLQTAVSGLQGLAVGAVMGLLREMVTTSVSGQMQQEITRLVDRVTTSLGGKPMDTDWLAESSASSPARQEEGQRAFATEGPATAPGGGQTTQQRRQERRKVANERR